jgi:hypothetical protein
MTRILDIKKADRRASMFSALSGGSAGLALVTLIVTASTMEFEDAIGHAIHSNMYYLLVFAGCLALLGISYFCNKLAAHIRGLIEDSIHEKNEREWSKR